MTEKEELISSLNSLDLVVVEKMAKVMIKALEEGRKILVCGNGGSAADAQHFVAELVCTFSCRERKALPALALTTNTSVLTAWANDFHYDGVFARQVEAYGKKGDVLLSITTSGNSKNILSAMEVARKMGLVNLLLTGRDGGKALPLADLALLVKSPSTPRIQECHIFALHLICDRIDKHFRKKSIKPQEVV